MKDFVYFVAASLTNQPDKVHIEECSQPKEYMLDLHIPTKEVGKLIGKHGAMINAFRILTKFYASKMHKNQASFRLIEDKASYSA